MSGPAPEPASPSGSNTWYNVRPLLFPALPSPSQERRRHGNPSALAQTARADAASSPATVRCSEAVGRNLYIGTSDGKVHRYTLSDQGTSSHADPYHYKSTQQISTNRKPIERLLLLPSRAMRLAAVLCESALTFYHLPSFRPVSPEILPAVKGLAAVVLDDNDPLLGANGVESPRAAQEEGQAESVSLCLIRRKGIVLVRLSSIPLPPSTLSPSGLHGDRSDAHTDEEHDPPPPSVFLEWHIQREISLPCGATMARRFGRKLLIATTSDYRLVDLESSSLDAGGSPQTDHIMQLGLPISQTQDQPSASNRPSILSLPLSNNRRKKGAGGGGRSSHHRGASSSGGAASAPASAGVEESCEFLVTSHSAEQTLGVFFRSNTGEPTPKLIEWPSHPRSVILVDPASDLDDDTAGEQNSDVESKKGVTTGNHDASVMPSHSARLCIALLRNDTIEIHDLDSMQCVQRVHLPDLFEARFLSSGTTGFLVEALDASTANGTDAVRDPLAPVHISLHPRPWWHNLAADGSQFAGRPQEGRSASRYIRARIILGGREGLQTLTSVSLLSRALSLLEMRNWDDLQTLVESNWAASPSAPPSSAPCATSNTSPIAAQNYLWQVLAFHHLKALRFEAAGSAFVRGLAPVPLLLRIFPDISQGLLSTGGACEGDATDKDQNQRHAERGAAPAEMDACIVPAGVEQEYQEWRTIDGIIAENLRWNYTPPLDVDSDPAALLLRQALHSRAHVMLRNILEDVRATRSSTSGSGYAGSGAFQCTRRMADTALARLYASSGLQRELGDLLSDEENACVMALVQPALEQNARYGTLAEVARRHGRVAEYLSLATRLIDGELTDKAGWKGTVQDVIDVLEGCMDSELVVKYGVWVATRDPGAGLRLLTRKNCADRLRTKKTTTEGAKATTSDAFSLETVSLSDHQHILEQLTKAGVPAAAQSYLEHVALAKKSFYPQELQQQLLEILYTSVQRGFEDAESSKMMAEAETNFQQGIYAESFLAHLALLAPQVPLIELRLKLALLLQASSFIDCADMLVRLEARGQDFLRFERSILLGKLGRHEEALVLLALQLHDANSAEAYCSQNGDVISPILVERIVASSELPSLNPYATFLAQSRRGAHLSRKAQENKTELLKTLLKVYTSTTQDDEIKLATAHVLNTQAMHLSPIEVLDLVRSEWPIGTLETFLSRFFRRQMHEFQQGQIVKSISFAQNLEAQEQAWADLRSLGGYIQDVDEDDDDEDQHGATATGDEAIEKQVTGEKMDADPDFASAKTEKSRDFNWPRSVLSA